MKKLAIALLLLTGIAIAQHNRGPVWRNSAVGPSAGITDTRDLEESGVLIDTLGVPDNCIGLIFRASGTQTADVDSLPVVFFRTTDRAGNLVKIWTGTDSLFANVDTADGTTWSSYKWLDGQALQDTLISYIKIQDNADGDSLKNVRVQYDLSVIVP